MISALVRSISGVWMVRRSALDRGLGGEVGHRLEGGDELGAAVGVAGVVDGVDADEDVGRAAHLGHRQGEAQEDGVAGGHVGDRDLAAVTPPPCASLERPRRRAWAPRVDRR